MKFDRKALKARFDKLSRREKVFFLLTLLALTYFLWESLFLIPVTRSQKELKKRITRNESTVQELQLQKEAILARKDVDPNREERSQLAGLQREHERLERKVDELARELIPPREMSRLLRELLEVQDRLTLVGLENLPPDVLTPTRDETLPEAEDAPPQVYRHPLRMEFEGSFADALAYLRALERLDGRLYWHDVSIETLEYPRAHIRIELFTLSLTPGWIGV